MQKIIISVTNDITTDQRVHKVATSLQQMNFDVLLVGRKLESSLPLKRNYKTHRIDLFFNKGVFFYAEYNFRLFFYILFKKKSILLANDLDTLLANYLVSKFQNKKLVYDSHELFTQVPELVYRPKTQKVWLRLEKWLLPQLKNTYTVCNSIVNYYNNLYQTDFKVVRNIPLFDAKTVRKSKKKEYIIKVENNRKQIIYQGALNVGRGLELMIDTMVFIDNTEFIIIGDGDISSALKQRVMDKKLTHKVRFIGKVTPAKLKIITPKADLGISFEEDLGLNYRYALPNKIFDYIHANIPVLVSNLPEMSALVNKYQVGEIIEKRTPKAIANQLKKMLEKDQNHYQNALKNAAQKLTWQNEEKTLQKIFHNLK